jgi:cell division protein FtsB
MPKNAGRPTPARRTAETKQPGRGRRIAHLLLLFVAAVIVVDGLVGGRGYDELSATIARERAENARLREQARRLREDPAAIEEIARRELGLMRPGEKVFIIKDVAPAANKP